MTEMNFTVRCNSILIGQYKGSVVHWKEQKDRILPAYRPDLSGALASAGHTAQ